MPLTRLTHARINPGWLPRPRPGQQWSTVPAARGIRLAGVDTCVLQEFAARVHLYTQWDRKLRPQTRFFGAAALTNAALVELCVLRCSGHLVGNAGVELLSTVGRRLERVNIEVARIVERGSLQRRDLDRALVTLEQSVLERVLRQEAARAPHSHGQAVQQINRLLFCVEQWVWPSYRWPSGYLYRGVLRRVRAQLGRRPDFAVLNDRIGIGEALIHALA